MSETFFHSFPTNVYSRRTATKCINAAYITFKTIKYIIKLRAHLLAYYPQHDKNSIITPRDKILNLVRREGQKRGWFVSFHFRM